MKRILFPLLLILICISSQSQNLPSGTPGKPSLPTPRNLQPVAKADLVITSFRLVSATGETTDWDVRVSVSIKNNGGLATPDFKIRGMAQNASAPNNPWKAFGDLDFPRVGPGETVTKELRFFDKNWIMHKILKFNLKLQADMTNKVSESNETNNESAVILISATR